MGNLNWIRLVFAWWSITSTIIERTEHEYVFENEFEIGWKNLAWSLESKESKVFNISPIEVIKQKKYQNGHRNKIYKSVNFVCLDKSIRLIAFGRRLRQMHALYY